MVRVLRCHHFSAQDVFTTDNEPLTVFTTTDLAFVATDQCYIEVYRIQEPGCPRAYRFPTVAPVTYLVYSEADDFIATLEEKTSLSETQTSIRVYINWRADLSKQPMRASIAGHMTSLRHIESDKSRFEVVEVPLKGTPKCITVDPTFGAIAVGLDQSLLVYGFCTKTVAETKEQYKDIKCLLELEFSFPIHQVALVEDYLAVSSENEVQVVMFKTPLRPAPEASDCAGAVMTKNRANSDASLTGATSGCAQPACEFSAFKNRSSYTPSPSQYSLSSAEHDADRTTSYVIEDEHFVRWTFDDGDGDVIIAKNTKSSKMASVAAASAQAVKTIVLKGLATVQGRKQQPTHHQGSWELLGPVDNPIDCPVTVEYEDVCNPACEKRGHVVHGVRTCLYRKFEEGPCSRGLHSLQLVPVYLHASHVRQMEARKCCVLCPALSRESLVGMSVFVSTQESGFLYNIQDTARLLATYRYTTPALRVTIGEHLLYALTSVGIEVYTSRGLASALHHMSPVDDTTNTLPPEDLEPCLLGLQPFIGAEELGVSPGHVVLLTKDTSLSGHVTTESSWSLYVLRCQPVVELYQDMMELADQLKMTSPPASLHLLQEAHLLLRTHRFLCGTDDDVIHGLICESAALLGDYYTSLDTDGNWRLALPYYVISGYDVGSIIRRVREDIKSHKQQGQGLLLYLDYMIFTQDLPISCSQEDGDLVVETYAAHRPEKLSSVLLRAALQKYSPEKALDHLYSRMQQAVKDQENARLDVLACAVLHMKMGQTDEAELKLFSLSQGEIFNTSLAKPWILHEDFTQFSPLAKMLCRHHRSLFTNILVALLDQGVFRVDQTIEILQDKSDQPVSSNRYIMDYLEQILANDRREPLFQETARRLVEIYMEILRKWTAPTSTPVSGVTLRDIIPKGHGHFAKRFMWLDYLPPFKGPKSLLTPCVKLQAVRTGMSTTESCTCCHCNAELLKLQSLLCSSHTSSETLNLVSSEVQDARDMRGQGSLRVLCAAQLKPEDALDALIAEFPSSLPHFAKEMLGAETHLWRHLIRRIVGGLNLPDSVGGSDEKRLKDADPRNSRQDHHQNDESENQTLQGSYSMVSHPQDIKGVKIDHQDFASILAHMSEVLSQQDLLSLIPPDVNASLFLPALMRTQEKRCAQQLKERIISHARQLQQRPA